MICNYFKVFNIIYILNISLLISKNLRLIIIDNFKQTFKEPTFSLEIIVGSHFHISVFTLNAITYFSYPGLV